MELIFVVAIGYAVWRFVIRRRPGGRSQPPPPKGRPVERPPFVYATYSAEGRDGWPAPVLKAVEGIYEVASADDPTTVAKMRTAANRLTKLGTPVFEFLDALMDSMPDDAPARSEFEDLHAIADELVRLTDEAEDAEDEFEVDVISRAQEFVDVWQKTPNP